MKSPKFEVFEDTAKGIRFHLVAPNGKIILASESYTTKRACLDTIKAISKYANAEVVDLTWVKK